MHFSPSRSECHICAESPRQSRVQSQLESPQEYVHTCVCVYKHEHIRIRIYKYKYLYIYICIDEHVCMRRYLHVHIYIYKCIFVGALKRGPPAQQIPSTQLPWPAWGRRPRGVASPSLHDVWARKGARSFLGFTRGPISPLKESLNGGYLWNRA